MSDDDDDTQGGFRLELLVYDAAGNVDMTYNLTSPADGYIDADNVTYVLSAAARLYVQIVSKCLLHIISLLAFCLSSCRYRTFGRPTMIG